MKAFLPQLRIGLLAVLAVFSAASAAWAQGPAYLFVTGVSFDTAKIGVYARALPPIYAKNQGRYLAVGGTGRGVTFVAAPFSNRSVIFAEFPDAAAMEGFWWGEDYRKAIRLRDGAGAFSVLGVTGTETLAQPRTDSTYLVMLMTPGEARKADAADADMIKAVTQAGGTLMTRGFTREFRPLEGDTLFDRIAIIGWTGPQARDQFLKGSRFKRLLAAGKSQGYPFIVALDSPAVVKAAAAKPPSAP